MKQAIKLFYGVHCLYYSSANAAAQGEECISLYHSVTNIKLNEKLLSLFSTTYFLAAGKHIVLAPSLLYTLKHQYNVKRMMSRLYLMVISISSYTTYVYK